MLRLAAQSWVDGFPNLRFFRYAIVPLVVSLRGKSDDAKVTLFTSLILFFTGLLKPGSQNARTPPLDEKRRFWTRGKSRSYAINDDKDTDIQRPHGNADKEGLEPKPEQRPQIHFHQSRFQVGHN